MDMKNLKASDVYKTLSGAQKVALYNQIQLEKNGPYAYSSEVEFEPAKRASLTTTHGMIEARMLQGGITLSDLYIAYTISRLGICDLSSIHNYLLWLHRKFPEKPIPDKIDIEGLKMRIKALGSVGIIRIFYLSRGEQLTATAFSITDIGAKAIKRRLEKECMNYDPWAFTDSKEKLCGKIQVAKLVSHLLGIQGVNINATTSVELYDKNVNAKRRLLGKIEFEKDEHKELMYIEPVTFQYDSAIKTEMEHMEDVRDRLQMYATIITDYMSGTSNMEDKYDDVSVIFIVDDYNSMSELIRQILNMSMTLANKCLVTTERLLYANRGKLYRAFYSVQEVAVNGINTPKILIDNKHEAIFGKDNYNDIALSYRDICDLGLAGICDDEK